MNYIFILDGSYTPYEGNKDITLNSGLVSGARTITGICVDPNGGTFSSCEGGSVIAGGCDVLVLSATCADGTSFKNSEELKNVSSVGFDNDIQCKVGSYSCVSGEQKKTLALALQLHKKESDCVTVISDSPMTKSILAKEGIITKTYKESGILYGWTCYR